MTFNLPPVSVATLLATFDRRARSVTSMAETYGVIPIAGCSPWTTLDLLAHLGRVYAMVDATVTEEAREPLPPGPEAQAPSTTDIGSLLEWYELRRMGVTRTLSECDPQRPVWTWGPPGVNGFYIRRMAHETTVHLLDLDPQHVVIDGQGDRDVLLDGIDEFFTVVLTGSVQRRGKPAPQGSLHLHCTDGPGEWLVSVSDTGSIDVRHEHAKGDVAWRASAQDLFATVWGRSRSEVEVLGDPEVSRQWSTVAP
ncbi:MAG: maleylpyruvate isomerase N-terminal domain-containing protein [Ilumatobacteraceae bacterium]